MLVLAALWWAWGAYAWLTNYIAADEGKERLLIFGAMGGFLVAALATPEAFGDDALIFGLAYAAVRWLHIFLFAEANDDIDTGQAIRRLARTALPGPALLIVAAFTDGTLQAALWVLALAIDFSGPFVFGVRGFRVSPGHFSERFSLIVIIALGESIVAIGAGLSGELDAGIDRRGAGGPRARVRALVGVLRRDRRCRPSSASERRPAHELTRIARDSYSYLHLPMIAGIVLVALGVKKTIGHVDKPLETVPAVALFGGVALYLGAHVGFRLRMVRQRQPPAPDRRAGLPGADPGRTPRWTRWWPSRWPRPWPRP